MGECEVDRSSWRRRDGRVRASVRAWVQMRGACACGCVQRVVSPRVGWQATLGLAGWLDWRAGGCATAGGARGAEGGGL